MNKLDFWHLFPLQIYPHVADMACHSSLLSNDQLFNAYIKTLAVNNLQQGWQFGSHAEVNYSRGKVVWLQGEARVQGASDQWLCGPDQVVHHVQSLAAAPLLSLCRV